jgi:hypothetical protein
MTAHAVKAIEKWRSWSCVIRSGRSAILTHLCYRIRTYAAIGIP